MSGTGGPAAAQGLDVSSLDEQQVRGLLFALSARLPPLEAKAIQQVLTRHEAAPCSDTTSFDAFAAGEETANEKIDAWVSATSPPLTLLARVQRWSSREVAHWLQCVGLGVYSGAFQRYQVNGS